MENITKISEGMLPRLIKPMDYVTNGIDVGRYFGTTRRGVHVVAWGDKRDDYGTAAKLIEYLNVHGSNY